MWVLIIVILYTDSQRAMAGIGTHEFKTLELCQHAGDTILNKTQRKEGIKTICVPNFEQKEQIQ